MAILIGIWESVLVLVTVVFSTTVVLRWYWQRRLSDLKDTYDRRYQAELVDREQEHNKKYQTEIRDLVNEFRHQALHCLRPIKDRLYTIKQKIQTKAITDTVEWRQFVENSLADIGSYEWRLTRLIENMTFVSRLEAPDLGLHFCEVKLDTIVSDVVSDFQDAAEAKGIKLAWWARPEAFPRTMANEESLRQGFINLIDNAIKYCEENDEIDVALEENGHKKVVCVQVSDTGPGIPEEDWELIFGKGYTVEAARGRKPKEGSQGLGLYIAKLVVEKHKGEIDVTSKLGRGTTFTITLPIHRI